MSLISGFKFALTIGWNLSDDQSNCTALIKLGFLESLACLFVMLFLLEMEMNFVITLMKFHLNCRWKHLF